MTIYLDPELWTESQHSSQQTGPERRTQLHAVADDMLEGSLDRPKCESAGRPDTGCDSSELPGSQEVSARPTGGDSPASQLCSPTWSLFPLSFFKKTTTAGSD
jgi:hypothetical protein